MGSSEQSTEGASGVLDCGPAPQEGGEAKGVVSVGEALEWGSTVSQESFHY